MSLLNLEYFAQKQLEGNLHPCWLITGDPYLNKEEFALSLTKQILYQNNLQPHGMPNSLIDKQLEAGFYPNYHYVSAPLLEDGTVGREINAETAKSVKTFLQKKPAVLGWRVVVINSIDIMNRFAANSLLKILEEPPKETFILLLCHRPGYVLPTIRSRCQVLSMKGELKFPDALKNLGAQFLKALKNYIIGQNIDSFKDYVLTHDKGLKNFFYAVLKVLTIDNKVLSHEHTIKAYNAVHNFFLETDQTHLDPKHVLNATFMLIKDPEL